MARAASRDMKKKTHVNKFKSKNIKTSKRMSHMNEITRQTSNVKISRIPRQGEIFIAMSESIQVTFPEAKN
jgi:hypothetical protein